MYTCSESTVRSRQREREGTRIYTCIYICVYIDPSRLRRIGVRPSSKPRVGTAACAKIERGSSSE